MPPSSALLAVLLAACSGGADAPEAGPPAGPLPAAGLAEVAPAAPWRALEHLDVATIELPEVPLPDTPETRGTFPVNDGWESTGRQVGRLRDWRRPLPFPVDMPRPNYAPFGARLYRGDRELPYVSGTEDIDGGGWWVERGHLHVLTLENPAASPVSTELRAPELAAELRRRNFAGSGQTPAEFVPIEATVGAVTRPALHVPAPGLVRFTLDVPAQATLDFGVALLPDPLLGAEGGDGARAVVRVDGEEAWSGEVEPGEDFRDATVSLAKWAGRTVSLELRSEPGGTPDFDALVWSAPTIRTPLGREPRRVVVVGIDTLRWDTLGLAGYPRDTSPELDAWAQGAVVFDHAYAPAPRTRPSFRTALTGRYPYPSLHAPTAAMVLADQGFRTAGIVANVHLVPRFGFNDGTEHWYYENGARAGDQVDRALAWLEAHAEEDTYLFLHLMDPHTHYNAPLPWSLKFTEGRTSKRIPDLFDRWQIVSLGKRGLLDDNDRALVRGRYDGEVAYTSHALGRLFAGLDALPGRTVTVVHADHGEEFWDHGGFEHNHTLYDELVRVLFAIRPPGGWGGGPHRVDAPVGLIDIVPTLLDLLGVPADARPPTDGTSLRPLLDAAAAKDAETLIQNLKDRPLVVGHLMFDTERWGVIHQSFKYILHTMSGREEVYDLAADPREQEDRITTVDDATLTRLRAALERGTGWPVRQGWRVGIDRRPTGPVRFTFTAPIEGAGVIDPEAGNPARANLEWGERPRVTVEAVGPVRISEDRTQVAWLPGPGAKGQSLYITCAGSCPTGTLTVGSGTTAPMDPGPVAAQGGVLRVSPGTILVPAMTEAEAIAQVPAGTSSGEAASASSELEALQALGYVAPH